MALNITNHHKTSNTDANFHEMVWFYLTIKMQGQIILNYQSEINGSLQTIKITMWTLTISKVWSIVLEI